MKNTALFSFKTETLPRPKHGSSTLPDKVELFEKLRQRDINPVVTKDAEAAFEDEDVIAHELEQEFTTQPIGNVALDSVGVVVNLLDRSFKKDRMPDTWNDAMLPTVNENAVRSLAFRKEQMHREVLQPLGLGMPTALASTATDVAIFTHEHPADSYILKPNSGSYSIGVLHPMTADQAIAYIADKTPDKPLIIQPKYDFARPFAPEIKSYDATSQEAFEGWGKSGLMKEFRMYAFNSPTVTNIFPVARTMHGGNDNWLFVDPESIPEKLFVDTGRIVSAISRAKGAKAVQAAVDFGYGAQSSSGPSDYHVIEVNAKMPYIISYDKHRQVADTLREHYADMLQDTIHSSTDLYNR